MLRSGARGFGHGAETQLVATADVTASEFFGLGLVAPRDGGNDRLVLAQRLRDASRRRECGAAKQYDGVMQVLQALQQKPIMRGAVDVLVEEGVFPGVNFRVIR